MHLRQDLVDDIAFDVCQSPLDAVVHVGQTLMIEPEQVQDGRIEIVERPNVLDRFLS